MGCGQYKTEDADPGELIKEIQKLKAQLEAAENSLKIERSLDKVYPITELQFVNKDAKIQELSESTPKPASFSGEEEILNKELASSHTKLKEAEASQAKADELQSLLVEGEEKQEAFIQNQAEAQKSIEQQDLLIFKDSKIAELEAKSAKTANALADKEFLIEFWKCKITELEQSLEARNQDLLLKESRIAELEGLLSGEAKAVADKDVLIASNQAKITELEQSLKSRSQEYLQIESKLAEVEGLVAEVTKASTDKDSLIESQKTQIAQHIAESERLSNLLAETQHSLEKLKELKNISYSDNEAETATAEALDHTPTEEPQDEERKQVD